MMEGLLVNERMFKSLLYGLSQDKCIRILTSNSDIGFVLGDVEFRYNDNCLLIDDYFGDCLYVVMFSKIESIIIHNDIENALKIAIKKEKENNIMENKKEDKISMEI